MTSLKYPEKCIQSRDTQGHRYGYRVIRYSTEIYVEGQGYNEREARKNGIYGGYSTDGNKLRKGIGTEVL
jgi:hypothetical protein